ncbi:MAG: ANTAR domain-containing protein [Actinomycetota bacterium]|nr:ANTAR domain-containing protein [Actinomycetota bacterium]
MRNALDSRIVIEQAKGAVAERHNLTMEQAFSTIRAHARNHNRLLIEVATDMSITPSSLPTLNHPH